MHALTLWDLKLGLADLLDTQGPKLQGSSTWKTYAPLLAAKRRAIDALPEASPPGGQKLIDELAEADAAHDGFGEGLYYMCEAYLRVPSADAAAVEAAKKVREMLLGSLGDLKASYADEATAARGKASALEGLKEDLRRIPLAGGGSLFDWANAMVDAGERIDDLLRGRKQMATPAPHLEDGPSLRRATIHLLERFRVGLEDEMSANPELPRNLSMESFAYLDRLATERASAPQRDTNIPATERATEPVPGSSAGNPATRPDNVGRGSARQTTR